MSDDRKVSPYNPGDVFQVEEKQPDGSTKFISIDSANNTRHTHTSSGNDDYRDAHTTRQSEPKGSPRRH